MIIESIVENIPVSNIIHPPTYKNFYLLCRDIYWNGKYQIIDYSDCMLLTDIFSAEEAIKIRNST